MGNNILLINIACWICLSVCLSLSFSLSLSLSLQAMRIILKTPAYVAIDDLHDYCGLPQVKDYLIECARKKLALMKRMSPLISDITDEYSQVSHIQENVSILDILE